ncbi:MAG: tetratricopeptide repeat protein [Akkermansiaceae bacterium]
MTTPALPWQLAIRILVIAATVLVVSCKSSSESEGETSEHANEPADFLPLIEQAEAGDTEAQFRLYRKYSGAKELEGYKEKAAKWCIMAAEQGNKEAYASAFVIYDHGTGVKRDGKQALKWLLKTNEIKPKSEIYCRWIAERYERGDGTPKDAKTAIDWYKKAGELGDNASVLRLGEIYNKGAGVPADPKLAYDYFYQAAAMGLDICTYYLAQAHLDGKVVEKDPLKAYAWVLCGRYSAPITHERAAFTQRNLLKKILTEKQQKDATVMAAKLRGELNEKSRELRKKRNASE